MSEQERRIAELEAENARLREALDRIRQVSTGDQRPIYSAEAMRQFADEALLA